VCCILLIYDMTFTWRHLMRMLLTCRPSWSYSASWKPRHNYSLCT